MPTHGLRPCSGHGGSAHAWPVNPRWAERPRASQVSVGGSQHHSQDSSQHPAPEGRVRPLTLPHTASMGRCVCKAPSRKPVQSSRPAMGGGGRVSSLRAYGEGLCSVCPPHPSTGPPHCCQESMGRSDVMGPLA